MDDEHMGRAKLFCYGGKISETRMQDVEMGFMDSKNWLCQVRLWLIVIHIRKSVCTQLDWSSESSGSECAASVYWVQPLRGVRWDRLACGLQQNYHKKHGVHKIHHQKAFDRILSLFSKLAIFPTFSSHHFLFFQWQRENGVGSSVHPTGTVANAHIHDNTFDLGQHCGKSERVPTKHQ